MRYAWLSLLASPLTAHSRPHTTSSTVRQPKHALEKRQTLGTGRSVSVPAQLPPPGAPSPPPEHHERPFHRTLTLPRDPSTERTPMTEHSFVGAIARPGVARRARAQGVEQDRQAQRGKRGRDAFDYVDWMHAKHVLALDRAEQHHAHAERRLSEAALHVIRLHGAKAPHEPTTEEEWRARSVIDGHIEEQRLRTNKLEKERVALGAEAVKHQGIVDLLRGRGPSSSTAQAEKRKRPGGDVRSYGKYYPSRIRWLGPAADPAGKKQRQEEPESPEIRQRNKLAASVWDAIKRARATSGGPASPSVQGLGSHGGASPQGPSGQRQSGLSSSDQGSNSYGSPSRQGSFSFEDRAKSLGKFMRE